MFNKFTKFQLNEHVSFEESNAIKGILILLIILGHTHYLTPKDAVLSFYLYRFHTVQFFILPFFYNRSNSVFTLVKLRETVIRFYVPFFIFFSLCSTVYLWSINDFMRFNLKESVYAFVIGNQNLITSNTGFSCLWFLPVFCAFTLLKNISDSIANKLNGLIKRKMKIILSLLITLMLIAYLLFIPQSYYRLFFVFHAAHLFTVGIITYFIHKIPFCKYAGAAAFIFLSIFLFVRFNTGNYEFFTVYPFVLQISAFLFLLSVKKIILKIPYLQQLGKISLPVYLVHVIIYNILEQLISYSVISSIAIYILTILLSVIISSLIYKMPYIRKLVLPKGYYDLISCFSCRRHNLSN